MNPNMWPRPDITLWSRPFWDGVRRHELIAQRCIHCGQLRYPPGPTCNRCLSDRHDWTRLTGEGQVQSWVVFHQVYWNELATEVPYNVALIRLAEDVLFISNLVGVDHAEVHMGMPVRVVFDDVDDDLTVPRFAPTEPSTQASTR